MSNPSARKAATPLVAALRLALDEAMATRRQRELERTDARRTLTVVDGGRRSAA